MNEQQWLLWCQAQIGMQNSLDEIVRSMAVMVKTLEDIRVGVQTTAQKEHQEFYGRSRQ